MNKICLIDYTYHDDSKPNPDMEAIKAALPEILIDNTPGGLWSGDCLPSEYTPLGIQVYSYITGGYEGTSYNNDGRATLANNLLRIKAIADNGATGVFLDEVSAYPTTAGKKYIEAIFNACFENELKLILNTGVSLFDGWLMSHCDYLMSDESYNGRDPRASEIPFKDRILVVNNSVSSAVEASVITKDAWSKGIGYAYCCDNPSYALPAYLKDYIVGITPSIPPTPVPRSFTFTGTFTVTEVL